MAGNDNGRHSRTDKWEGVIPDVAVKEKRGKKIRVQPVEEPFCMSLKTHEHDLSSAN